MKPIIPSSPMFDSIEIIRDEPSIEDRLKRVATMPELDAMRVEVVKAMQSDGTEETFTRIQKAFVSAKNRLQRIPLRERTW